LQDHQPDGHHYAADNEHDPSTKPGQQLAGENHRGITIANVMIVTLRRNAPWAPMFFDRRQAAVPGP
jgi:hypothetical protein